MLGLTTMVYYFFGLAFLAYMKDTSVEDAFPWWFLVVSGLAWPVVAPLMIVADLIGQER